MAIVQRTRVIWEGFPGGPGYTNLYARGTSNDDIPPELHSVDVAAAFEELGTLLPAGITLTIQGETAYYEDTTGELLEIVALDEVPEITLPSSATRGGAYSAPSGGMITWETSAVRDNRRVLGSTFLVPLRNVAYEEDGSLSSAALVPLRAMAQTYVEDSVSNNVVWSRPRPGREGSSHSITGYRVPDRAAILRSRRD